MPRYFMHLRTGAEEMLDPDGMVMPEAAVVDAALLAARDCLAGDVRTGRLDLRFRIDVHDESGAMIHSLKFGDAFKVLNGF